jgi:hypothetical protein
VITQEKLPGVIMPKSDRSVSAGMATDLSIPDILLEDKEESAFNIFCRFLLEEQAMRKYRQYKT